MPRPRLIILYTVGGFAGLLALSATALLFLVDANVYKPRLETTVSRALGMEVSIRGQLGFAVFPRLKERENQIAGTLSGGEQQMLAIGRALMSRPRFLMLDEPSLGLAPLLVKTIFEKIVEINREHGITVLLVEQNANLALEISHFGYVLETGRINLQDTSAALRQNPQVKSAYLGGG